MPTIYLPTFAFFRKDVETMFGILEKDVPNKYIGIGLEIYGKREHFQEEGLGKIVRNIGSVAGGVKTIVHGIIGDIYPGGIADMSRKAGRELLMAYINLAKRLGSEYVHTHGGAGYRGIEVPADKQEVLEKIRNNFFMCLEKADGIPVGIENAPIPSGGDIDENSKTVWSDYVEGIEDCMQIVRDTPLKITFDTAHYGSSNGGNVNLVLPVIAIEKQLGHIHLGDYDAQWVPNVSKFSEGIIPGDGKIGNDSFQCFFKYIKRKHPEIGVGIEVHNKDYSNPLETKECLRRVCSWLK